MFRYHKAWTKKKIKTWHPRVPIAIDKNTKGVPCWTRCACTSVWSNVETVAVQFAGLPQNCCLWCWCYCCCGCCCCCYWGCKRAAAVSCSRHPPRCGCRPDAVFAADSGDESATTPWAGGIQSEVVSGTSVGRASRTRLAAVAVAAGRWAWPGASIGTEGIRPSCMSRGKYGVFKYFNETAICPGNRRDATKIN